MVECFFVILYFICMNGVNIGILWFLLSLIMSALNDGIIKYISPTLGAQAVLHYRFFFATLTLLPFVLVNPLKFRTRRIILHCTRGVILFTAMFLWCSALMVVKITCATLISFTIPIFILILAPIFLQEKVPLRLWIATLVCFFGITMILEIGAITYNTNILKLLFSALLFATLDVINKKFVTKEPMLIMLFYSNLVTLMLSFIVFGKLNLNIGLENFALLLVLGVGANGILYCMLKAFSHIDASKLSPYRYLELVVSFSIGYVVFGESLTSSFILGAAIIIFATLYVNRDKLLLNKPKS